MVDGEGDRGAGAVEEVGGWKWRDDSGITMFLSGVVDLTWSV